MTRVQGTRSADKDEAQFWDESDLTELGPEDLEPVEIRRPSRPLSTTFAVRLDQESVEQIRTIARARGIGPTQLARTWMLERLRLEARAGELANPDADEEELRIRRAVMDDVAEGIPDLVAVALLAVGVGAAGAHLGAKASQAKKRRDARKASEDRKRRNQATTKTGETEAQRGMA